MTIFDDTLAWRGDLPHLQRRGTTYFVTFCTRDREILASHERDVVLRTIVWAHRQQYWLHALVVMPDHVHHVFTVYEELSLARVMQRIKSVSAHEIGRRVWQREYFDRVMRSDEDVRKKCEYICQNPVRAGMVDSVDDYRWVWRSWIEGEKRGGEAASAP